MSELRYLVSELIGRPGAARSEAGSIEVGLVVGESAVEGTVGVQARLEGIADGVLARFRAVATARLTCTRCLLEWEQPLEVAATQVFEWRPDEDGYGLERGERIDLAGPVRDEIALALPLRPLCRPDCAGLCPTCGNDLNRDPCGGHPEPVGSPFAALGDLFHDPPA